MFGSADLTLGGRARGAMGSAMRWTACALGCAIVLACWGAARADASAFWGNNGGAIGRVNPAGTVADMTFLPATLTGGAKYTAADATHLYWTSYGGKIGRSNLDGTGVNSSFISGLVAPMGIAVDDTYIYWATYDTAAAGSTIGRARLDGTQVQPNFIVTSGETWGLAVNGTHIIWTQPFENWIMRARLDGTQQGVVVGVTGPFGLAVNAGHLYWTSTTANTIGRANLDGSGGDVYFIQGASSPYGVAVDATQVYWTNNSTNKIGTANLDGSSPNQSFVSGAASPFGIAAQTTTAPAPPPPPVCAPVSVNATSGQPISVALSCTGSALTYAIDAQPAHGALSGLGTGVVTYTPTAGYAGADTFTYHASNVDGSASVATVSITVAAAPAPDPVPSSETAAGSLGATVGPYLALTGGVADFGTVVPSILGSTFMASTSLSVSTSSPTGVTVSAAPSGANTTLNGLGAVSVRNASGAFAPLGGAVAVVSTTAPVNAAYPMSFKLAVPAGKVLRSGDTYSEPITYTATATLP